jgi:DNA-binding NtrC family response regulator
MSCRVLVVEDETVIAMLVEDLLVQSDCFPVIAATKAEALSSIEQGQPFELAVVDLQLPDGSGSAVVAELWKRWPVPVIVNTGYGDVPEDLKDSLAPFPAPLETIAKPWDVNQFLNLVQQLLPRADARGC